MKKSFDTPSPSSLATKQSPATWANPHIVLAMWSPSDPCFTISARKNKVHKGRFRMTNLVDVESCGSFRESTDTDHQASSAGQKMIRRSCATPVGILECLRLRPGDQNCSKSSSCLIWKLPLHMEIEYVATEHYYSHRLSRL